MRNRWLSCHRFFVFWNWPLQKSAPRWTVEGQFPSGEKRVFIMQAGQIITNEQQEIRQPSDQADLSVSKTLSFEDFKKSLGQNANKYSDEQIESMRMLCDKIADLVFDAWLNKRNAA